MVMNKLILLMLLISSKASALEFKIQNVCEDSLFLDSDISIFLPAKVSDITIYALNNFNVPYEGNSDAISSLIGTPNGNDLVEYISNDHLYVYGWCYEVDGVQPDVFMSHFIFDPEINKTIKWVFGFAEFRTGEWLTYCTPVHKDPRPFICKDF